MTLSTRAFADRLIGEELAAFRVAHLAGNITAAWVALERAHILSQPYLGPHLANHWAMLGFAVELRDWREVAGQLARLILAPLGALTGSIPIGNTGRSNVSAFKPMPIADDLRAKMNGLVQ